MTEPGARVLEPGDSICFLMVYGSKNGAEVVIEWVVMYIYSFFNQVLNCGTDYRTRTYNPGVIASTHERNPRPYI